MSAPLGPTAPELPDAGPTPVVGNYPRAGIGRKLLLWFAAIFIMFAAYAYQKRTGPTYPLRGSFQADGTTYKYKLIRSEETVRDARVAVPQAPGVSGSLSFKRFKTDDPFTTIPLQAEEIGGVKELAAPLPSQPPAGKLEYYVELEKPNGSDRIPADPADNIIIRFKDPVPNTILFPHITLMFFSMLIGMRAGLSALFELGAMRRWAWVALFGMTLGGMVFGPIVQKYAFGEYWTGFPWGYDLTDNKMLIMWVSWVLACSIIGFQRRPKDGISRSAVVVAALVMTAVYMIPHSMRGSELDYSKIDQGIPASKAIGTGE
jgi:hypothetical protein